MQEKRKQVFGEKQMRHTTCVAQRNEVRLTSIAYAWLSLYANSAQRSKLLWT